MKTSRLVMVVFTVMLSGRVIPYAVAQDLPAGANTTDPSAPFYIDLTGLDFSTSPPTRNPFNPNYPPATTLRDGVLPPVNANGNFIIGATHKPAPEVTTNPTGKVYIFTMTSNNSTIYPTGLVRLEPSFDYAVTNAPTAPGDFSNMLLPSCGAPGVTTNCVEVGTWTRKVLVYVPQRVRGHEGVPFIAAEGLTILPGTNDKYGELETLLLPALDNLINEGKIPPMVAITVESGGQDAQGSQRGFELDTVSGQFAEFIQNEVLPMAEQVAGIHLTRNPAGRIYLGASSSGATAFTMAWFHPEWFGKILAYSPTMLNQQWPHNPNLPGGAWQLHSQYAGPIPNPVLNTEGLMLISEPTATTVPSATPLFLASPTKPIRVWFEVGDRDAWYFNQMADGMRDSTLGSENMAKALAAKGYEYQFIFSKNAGHVDYATLSQTLPNAIVYLMQGYRQDGGYASEQ